MNAVIITPARTHLDYRLHNAIAESGLPVLALYEHSDLPRVRSFLVSKALAQPGVDRILFVDSDIVPTGAQLTELATSPLVTPDQALTGLYPTRDGREWAVKATDPATADAVFRAEWAGLGFAAVHRLSLERVAARLPDIVGDGLPWKPFCVPLVLATGEYLADDRSLWWRLAQAGVGLVADRSLRVGHVSGHVLAEPT